MSNHDAEQEVREVIDAMTEAMNSNDADKLEKLLADRPGSAYIGSDPDESWSKDEIVSEIREASSVDRSPIRGTNEEVSVHVLGDVAWAEGTGNFLNDGGGARPVRMTGVFVREHGSWKATQLHASIGVANQDIFSS